MQNSHRSIGDSNRPVVQNARISCGLINSAGNLAADIASFFPFPHFGFLRLPPARMHLVGLVVAGIQSDAIDIDLLTSKKFADAASALADPCPVGLEGILASLTFPLWPAASYQALWSLMVCTKARKILAHTKSVDPALVSILSELPPPLRKGSIVRHLRRPMEAAVLADLCTDDVKAENLGRVLQNCDTRTALFSKLVEFVEKQTLLPVPPHIEHELIQPILTVHELSRTALYFRNCLRTAFDEAVSGEVAFYVLGGLEPAVFSIEPRIGGWVISQIKGINNTMVSQETTNLVRKAMTDSGLSVLNHQRRYSRVKWSLERLGAAEIDDYREIEEACLQLLATKNWAD